MQENKDFKRQTVIESIPIQVLKVASTGASPESGDSGLQKLVTGANLAYLLVYLVVLPVIFIMLPENFSVSRLVACYFVYLRRPFALTRFGAKG